MLISKLIGYVLIHLLNLGVPSPLRPQRLSIGIQFQLISYASHLQIGTCKVNKKTPGGMKGSKFIQLVLLLYPNFFRATSVYDMI